MKETERHLRLDYGEGRGWIGSSQEEDGDTEAVAGIEMEEPGARREDPLLLSLSESHRSCNLLPLELSCFSMQGPE